MENFAQILDGLEKDVIDLVSDLEIQIRKRIAVSGRTSTTTKEPAKPFEPKWRGLRGALRWLWKGQSKDNPDYAHLYDQDGTKKEQSERRPTLAEYLEEIRTIDGFAEEIFAEEFGTTLAESFVDLSDLIVRFKASFRNIILKYKSLIRGSVPAEAPASPAKDAAPASEPPSSPASKDSTSATTSEPPSATGSQSSTISSKQTSPATSVSENPPEKESRDSASDKRSDGGGEKETEKTEPAKVEKAEEERKSKSHSANIKRWFEEAMEAKRKGGDELKPKPDWLNPKGIIKAEKLPWVIAWMGTKSHKDLNKDEDVRAELASVLGSSFKDFVPQIAKKKSDSLVGYLRKKMPMASDEDFKKMVSDLYGSEYEGSGLSSQKSKKTTNSSAEEAGKEEKEVKPQEPDIQEIKIKTLSSLYDGMDKKEQILDAIEDKIIERAYDMMESDADAEYFANWWKSFKRERMGEGQETVESLIARINSGAMFDDILRNSEVSKNKPEKKIKLRTLMDMLKT